MKWYYKSGDKKVGPIAEFELHKRASRGEIGPEDLVCNDASEKKEWVKASTIPGLIRASSPDDKPRAQLKTRPKAAIGKPMKTLRMALEKRARGGVITRVLRKMDIEKPSRKETPQSYEKQEDSVLAKIFVCALVILLAGYFIFTNYSGDIIAGLDKLGISFGGNLGKVTLSARAGSFGRDLVSLRNRGPNDARQTMMSYMQNHRSSENYVNKLCNEYCAMTVKNCAVGSKVSKISLSADKQRATVNLHITMLKEGKHSTRSMQMFWVVEDRNWVAIPN